jgi:hypothetical protein
MAARYLLFEIEALQIRKALSVDRTISNRRAKKKSGWWD